MVSYINSINEKMDLLTSEIRPSSDSTFHTYSWSPVVTEKRYGVKVKQLNKTALQFEVNFKFIGGDVRKNLNRFYEITDYDAVNEKEGKLIWGDYYLNCFIITSKIVPSSESLDAVTMTCTVYAANPFWIKETTTHFNVGSSGIVGGHNLDFPFGYEYDYTTPLNAIELINNGYTDTEFKIVFFGECTDPAIMIGTHKYQVECEINPKEYVTIDSYNKKIFLTKNNGDKVNLFSKRNRDSYIFQKIPVGTSKVSWSSDFKFDISLIEQRSEPKWI